MLTTWSLSLESHVIRGLRWPKAWPTPRKPSNAGHWVCPDCPSALRFKVRRETALLTWPSSTVHSNLKIRRTTIKLLETRRLEERKLETREMTLYKDTVYFWLFYLIFLSVSRIFLVLDDSLKEPVVCWNLYYLKITSCIHQYLQW